MTTNPPVERLTRLRAAYPQGLNRRGVSGIEGLWSCVFAGKDREGHDKVLWRFSTDTELAWWPERDEWAWIGSCPAIPPGSDPAEYGRRDELLPDLADPATWALALHELGEACGLAGSGDLTWRRVQENKWALTRHAADLHLILYAFLQAAICGEPTPSEAMSGVEPMVGFDVTTADPIEALLLARAGLRKEK